MKDEIKIKDSGIWAIVFVLVLIALELASITDTVGVCVK